MMLDPYEAALIRRHLHDPTGEDGFAILSFQDRLAHEAPPLGEHVFRLVCELGTDAAKKVAANTKARKEAREALGVNRLPKGEGPDKIIPLMAATLNEYNGLDPWRKEALRKAYDEEIETRKKEWPSWWCGCVDTLVPRPDKTSKCRKCKGAKVNGRGKPCRSCGGTGTRQADPLMQREGGRRRIVVVTRVSSVRPDELSVDVLGGKIPIDRLVQAGVLRGDNDKWLARYGLWQQASPGEGRVVVDVYEVGSALRD